MRVGDDAEGVARAVARRFAEMARACVSERGSFSVALAGGTTPKRVYELLADEELRGEVPWEGVHVFFGDERCVPPDHADSNYRMAHEALLARVPVPEKNIHRMRGEGDAVAGARLYEDELRAFFSDAEWPRLDLVMLGMGDDGHTASLFPGTTALGEQRAWVVANWVEKFETWRVTLTAPAINHARHVFFVVTGAGKAARLAEILKGERDPSRLPSQLIEPEDGMLEWFVDRDAAAAL
ncbi:MAG: 6-phosphogluconolactonase [Acidobacteria bacterium]|nr:6-phosphogluconolactonase [Acidobacteriota bacterium]